MAKAENDDGGENGEETRTKKKDLKRLLKIALDVEMNEKQLGEVDKVLEADDKTYTEL